MYSIRYVKWSWFQKLSPDEVQRISQAVKEGENRKGDKKEKDLNQVSVALEVVIRF